MLRQLRRAEAAGCYAPGRNADAQQGGASSRKLTGQTSTGPGEDVTGPDETCSALRDSECGHNKKPRWTC